MTSHKIQKDWKGRLKSAVPFGLGQTKPKHFRDMLGVACKNRDHLGYAWKVLSQGVCDGCALGVAATTCSYKDSYGTDLATLRQLPARKKRAQATFAKTGGLHAAAVFDAKGSLVVLLEDIGRHNAVDKVMGWGFLENKLPFDSHILLVSGRASFEILQKITRGAHSHRLRHLRAFEPCSNIRRRKRTNAGRFSPG
jgi:hypothetical protein